MFKIIKKEVKIVELPFDMDAAKSVLIAGMIDDSVFDIPTAVEVAGAKNGDQIGTLYKELKQELTTLSHAADTLTGEGKTNFQMINGINVIATNFNAADIQTLKEEEYGSIDAWKAVMLAKKV